jgi:hypothetical protein
MGRLGLTGRGGPTFISSAHVTGQLRKMNRKGIAMTTDEKVQLYRQVKTAFTALCAVLFPNDERTPRGMPLQLRDACELALAGLSLQMAVLEAEIGTDRL